MSQPRESSHGPDSYQQIAKEAIERLESEECITAGEFGSGGDDDEGFYAASRAFASRLAALDMRPSTMVYLVTYGTALDTDPRVVFSTQEAAEAYALSIEPTIGRAYVWPLPFDDPSTPGHWAESDADPIDPHGED